MRILYAEDDTDIGSAVTALLKSNRYAVDYVENGEDALYYLKSTDYDLAILDIMMPVMSGLETVRLAREAGIETPVLFLTAKDSVEDRVTGLYSGADDYLTKPFAFEELLARVHVLLRRAGTEKAVSDEITLSDLTVNLRKKTVCRAGKEIALTSREYAILEYLIRNAGAVLTREQIQSGVWGYEYEGVSNMIDVYIRNLRKKLDEGHEKKLIHTVRYTGYVLKEEK